jgi:DNA-binding MarR family transcriptional regulator
MNESEKIDNIRKSTRDIVLHLGYIHNLFAHIGSVSQCYALHMLNERDMTPRELSAELLLDKTTISRLAKSLLNRGYVKTEVQQKDRRSHLLKLTVLGREKLFEINRIARGQVQNALRQIPEDKQELISNGLAAYSHALKESSFMKVQHGTQNSRDI